jgi:hypothetical protein
MALSDCSRRNAGTNEPAWAWPLPGGTAWVIVQIVPTKRSFSVDLFWQRNREERLASGLGVRPWEPDRGIPPFRFNLGGLWQTDAVTWVAPDPYGDDRMTDILKELSLGRGFVFSRSDVEKWILEHPQLYPSPLGGEERLVFPVVDHAVVRILEYAVPYFRRVSHHPTGADGADAVNS